MWDVGTMCTEKLMVPNRWSINVEAKKTQKTKAIRKTVPSSYDSVVDSSYWVHDRHILVTIFTSLIFGNLECKKRLYLPLLKLCGCYCNPLSYNLFCFSATSYIAFHGFYYFPCVCVHASCLSCVIL